MKRRGKMGQYKKEKEQLKERKERKGKERKGKERK